MFSFFNKMQASFSGALFVFFLFIHAILVSVGINPYKDYPKPNYPEGSINHNYSVAWYGYDTYYGYTSLQGVLNMINTNDKEGIVSRFSQSAKSSVDLNRQVDILFDYFDDEILDFDDEGIDCMADHVKEGEYVVNPKVKVKTSNYIYLFSMKITIMNNDENLVGINSINVIRQDIQYYYLETNRNIPWSGYSTEGIDCVDYNGLIR